MSASWSRVLGLMIVSSWLVVACSSAKKIEAGATCILNTDCNSPLVCSMDRCHDACHKSADCPAGESCITASDQSTVCQLPVETHCVYPSDCKTPLTCAVDQRCHNQCQADVDCRPGQTCTTTGTCAEPTQVDPNNNLIATDGGVGGSGGASGGGGTDGSIGSNPDASPDLPADVRGSTGGANSTGGASGGAPGTGGSTSPIPDASPDLAVDAPASTGGTTASGGTTVSGGTTNTGGTTGAGGATSPPDAGADLKTGTPDSTFTPSETGAPDLPPATPDSMPDAPAVEAALPDVLVAVDKAIDSPAASADAGGSDSPVGQDGSSAGPQTCKVNGECASVHCVDGYCCDKPCSGTCEACNVTGLEGICSPIPAGTDPAAECQDQAPCVSTCNGKGACSPVCGEVGAPCASQSNCRIAQCVDGYCCDSQCTGKCNACNVPGLEGTCSAVLAGQDPRGDCDADAPATCGLNGYCDGKGLCQYYGSETACNDGDDICSLNDHCNGSGACVGTAAPNFTPCTVVTTPDYAYDICVHGKCVSPGTCTDTSCNAPSFHFPLPDTNQRQCQDATGVLTACPGSPGGVTCATTDYCGQDAQYGWDVTHAASERFTRAGTWEPTVADNVTGLMWQGCVAGLNGADCTNGTITNHPFADAMTFCENSSWGGYTDWRLADQFEALSLGNFGSATIDATAFPNLAGGLIWTTAGWTISNESAGCGNGWPLRIPLSRYDNGPSAYCDFATSTRTLCVRGSGTPRAATRFVRTNGWEPVVSDADTGLMWQGCAGGMNDDTCSTGTATFHNWHDALEYCEAIVWSGYDDWHLPSVIELVSIVEGAQAGSGIDAAAFPQTPTTVAFACSTPNGTASEVWDVSFSDGRNTIVDKTSALAVRCVRKAN